MSGEYDPLATCPCCGYRTISTAYEICDICCWEYDPHDQNFHPDDAGGPNLVSLREAQQNFLRCGAISEKYREMSRPPTAEDERDPTWKPVPPLPEGVKPTDLFFCACCGHKTISFARFSCSTCGWRIEPEQEADPDLPPARPWLPSANRGTLREAQWNYLTFGHVRGEFMTRVLQRESPPADAERDPNWKALSPPPDWDKLIEKFFCACCGYKAVSRAWPSCFICGWIFDPEQEADPDAPPPEPDFWNQNHTSLREAQRNFLMFGGVRRNASLRAQFEPKPIPPDVERDPNWKPVPP